MFLVVGIMCQLLCHLILFDLLTCRDRSAKLTKWRLAHCEVHSINCTACDERTEIPPISCRILTNGLIVDRLCRNAFSQQRAINSYCEENLCEISTSRNLNSNVVGTTFLLSLVHALYYDRPEMINSHVY